MGNTDVAAQDRRFVAHTYDRIPISVTKGEGVWLTDVEGRRYLDMLAGYSALNFGHTHPLLLEALIQQAQRLTLTSGAMGNDVLPEFAERLAAFCGKDMVVAMNSGAEAVETALKLARKWAYVEKGVEQDRAAIVVAERNFHGRTLAICSASTTPYVRGQFGPYMPGFTFVPFGDAGAIRDAVNANTAAVLIEPIQGEAGVIIPPDGYLKEVREICTQAGTLLIADEIQSGLGRTGFNFAFDYESVVPDVYIVGKALGGALVPLSAVVGSKEVVEVFQPGDHGSTFGGNPLACAVGIAVLKLLETGELQEHAHTLGRTLRDGLEAIAWRTGALSDVRSRGLWAGIDIDADGLSGKDVSRRLLNLGVLAKETHGKSIRFAPPLVISEEELVWALSQIETALTQK